MRKGQLVETIARVAKVGRTSMRVDVDLVAEDLLTGDRKLCTRGRYVMVALDKLGRPVQAPPLPVARPA